MTAAVMLLAGYDIVFQEVPGEVTLALNLAGCPNLCPGCHSPHLRDAVGEPLDDELMTGLLARYGNSATCVAFMGGDGNPEEVNRLAALVKALSSAVPAAPTAVPAAPALKTAWYSGRAELSPAIDLANFDFIKLGPYDPTKGGLDSPDTTNQRFYRIEWSGPDFEMVDATELFRKKSLI